MARILAKTIFAIIIQVDENRHETQISCVILNKIRYSKQYHQTKSEYEDREATG